MDNRTIRLSDAIKVVKVLTTFSDAQCNLIEALSALPAVGGWLPIESAPHDEYIILCGYLDGPHDPRIKMGYWWAQEKRWKIDGASWRPVYYMPLPAPPIE